jgi:hypothetical protein
VVRVAGVDPLEPGNAKLAKAREDSATLRAALQVLAKELGFTPEAVAAKIKAAKA